MRDYHSAVALARRVLVARRYLAKGYDLEEAARAASIAAPDLDLRLWQAMGLDYSEMCVMFRKQMALTV